MESGGLTRVLTWSILLFLGVNVVHSSFPQVLAIYYILDSWRMGVVCQHKLRHSRGHFDSRARELHTSINCITAQSVTMTTIHQYMSAAIYKMVSCSSPRPDTERLQQPNYFQREFYVFG